MSLINDMLKNLEKTGRHASTRDFALSDLKSTLSIELGRNKNYYIVIASLISVLALCFGLTVNLKHAHKHITELTPAPLAAIKNPISNNMPPAQISNDIPVNPTLLTGIAMQIQQNNTFLRLLLNQNAIYRLSANMERNELIIIFEHTTLTAALPKMNYTGSGIESIDAFNDNEGNLKLVMQLSSGADLKRLELNTEGKAPELQLDILFPTENNAPITHQPEAARTIPIIIKKPVLESHAEALYQQALALSNNGEPQKAIQALEALLVSTPDYINARTQLVALLLAEGKKAEATKVIHMGLAIEPNNAPLTELAARLLVDEDKVDQALHLLEKSAPSVAQHTEYHALIAALYERQGKNALAASLYKQLLALQPTNAKWWLGLGIALEGAGQRTESLEAFSKANDIGGLNPELKAYIQSRLD